MKSTLNLAIDYITKSEKTDEKSYYLHSNVTHLLNTFNLWKLEKTMILQVQFCLCI